MEKQDFISNLYSSLVAKGVTGIGDPISFRAHLTQDKNGPDKLYDAMQSRGYQLGNRDNFRNMIQPVPSKTAPTQIQANTIAAMSARALENRRRENAEQLSRKTKQLANYQNQPAFDTGNAEANKYLVKSQGQLDKQAQELADKQNVQGFVAPKVTTAINTAEDAANESYYKQEQELQKMPDFGQGQGNTMRLAAMQKNNRLNDPQKIIQSLQKEIGSYYQDPTVKAQIKQDANSLGISTKDYIDNYVQPKLQDSLSQEFDKQEVLKNMPKSTAEYIIQGATNGIAGMLMQGLVNTPSQQKYINEATAATEKGLNPDAKPNTAAKLGNFTVSVTADAPFFGLTGKTSSLLVKQIAKREIGNLVGKGFSRAAATRVIGAKLENSVGKRVASRIVEGTVANAANMSAYNTLSETARQVRDSEFNPAEIGKQALNGAATGAALGVPGGIIGGAASHLSGAKKVLASTAGFLAEAGTFATTGEAEKYLQGNSKDIHFGQDFLQNAEQLLVMKATGGHLLQGVKNLFTPTHEGVSFTKDEISDIDQSAAAKNLFSSLSNMAPEESQYPEGTFSNKNEDLQKNYANFMKDKDVTFPEKQKVALTFGGPIQTVIPPTASYKTIDNGDGTSTVTTRDTKGNAIFRKTFSKPDELNQYINRVNVDVNLNDLNSIKKDNPYAVAEGIVSLRTQNKYSKDEIDNVVNGNGNPDESLNKDILSDIYQETLPYAYPASEPHTEHDYQEGQKLQGTDRNQAIAEADGAEAALDYKPGNVESENFKNDVIAGREHPNAALADILNNYSTEQGQLAIDYYNKYWKSKGVMDNAIDDVEQQVKTANKRVESNTHTSGQIIEASDGDKHYYVVAGKIAYDTEGNIDKNDTDKALVIRDTQTGELSSISPDRLTVVGTFEPQELKDRNETELRQQLIEQTDSELSTQTSEQPVTSDEQAQAGENQPLAKKDVVDASQTVEQPQQKTEKQSKPISQVESESTETNSVFPKNARGEKLYTKTEPGQAFDELKNDTGSESGAMEIAQSSISDLADELKAHDRKKAKLMRGKTPAEKIEIQKQFVQEKAELENEKRSWEKILQVPIDRSSQKQREEIAAREQANKELEKQKHDQLVTEEQNKELQDVKPFSREGNPSAEFDTEDAARARGFRNLDGKRIERQDHTEGVYGHDASVTFSQNDVQVGDNKISGTQPTRYKVIDASQLQPSHTESGKNAAFFIDSAQPKQDSNDADREQALEKIAAHIDSKQVTGAGGAYQNSAPTVNKRGEVIQGNNRSRGLKLMYEGDYPESQQKYKNYLVQHADDFGLNVKDIQKIKHPVLVNEADVDDNTAIALGQKRASDLESGGETLIATKNAVTALMQVDSKTGGMKMRTFTGRLLETDNPDATFAELIAKNGAKALDYLYEQGIINDTERKNSLNDFGNINDNGKKAIMDIMKEYLFAGNKQLKTYFSTLRDAAQGAILKTFTRDFENPPGESLLPYLRESLGCLHAALSDDFFKSAEGNSDRAQRAMEEFLNQGILFGEKKSEREKYSIFATELAWRLQGMGARGLTDMFNRLYDKVQGVKENDMFDTSDGEPVSVEKAIQIVFGIEQNKIDKYGNNGQNERSDVAVPIGTSAERRQRSTESSGNSEQDTQTEGTTNNTGGTASDSAEGGRDTETKQEKAERPRSEQEIGSGESQKPVSTDKSPSDLFAEAGKAVQQEKNRRQTNADIAQAEHNTEKNPTEAQKEAGNYKKGHVNIDGFDITIENPRGSIRRGTDKDWSKWETEMHNTYGYIRGTQGVDGDHIDVYLSDNPTKGDVFVIDQTNPDGSFDEHKVMYGFNSEQEAKKAYLSNYAKGWKGLGNITQVSKEEFKKWINSSHRKTKPFPEYTSVNKDAKVSDDKANSSQKGDTSVANEEIVLNGLGHSRYHSESPANEELSRTAKIVPEFENSTLGEEKIISHIENLSSKLNTNVHIVGSKDVPKDKEENPHKGVKGWYDTKTGEVFINLDECKGERDASETLLHEVVGHKGLRALMGEDGYKKYMRAFLTNAQEDVRANISNTAINQYKGNFYEAIDEYLATEAERGTGKRDMWQRLTDSLRDFLYKMGFTKFAPSISIYDTKRIFWESKNNLNSKNPLDAAKQAAFMRKLRLEELREPQFSEDGRYWSSEETDNRYKKDQEEKEETPERTILKKMYEDSVTSLSSRWYEAFVDSMQSVDKLQKAIMAAKEISSIKDSEDAYTSMLQLSSKSTSETEQFLEMNYRNMFNEDKDSVVKIMNAAGLKGKDGYEDFKYYLLTKSGLERNRDFAVRDWASKKDADGVAAVREQSIQNISDLFLKYSKNQKDAETKKAIYDLIENSVKRVLGYMPGDERMQVQSGLEANATEVFMGRMKTDEFLKGLEENLVTEAELFRRTYAVEKEIKTNELKLGRIGFDEYNHYLDNLVSKRFNFDPTKTDYSGLSSLFPNAEGKGTDYQKAIDTVMSLEEKVGNERINNMWNLIKGISDYTLEKQADCGIISEQSKEHVSKMFNWYIPMRGFKETTADEVYDYITAKPSIFNPTLKTAKGRTTIAEDPLANIGNMACSAILQGNKNLTKQRLLRFSQNNPTSLLTSDWEWIQNMGTKDNPDWQKVFPDIPVNASSKEVKEIFDAFKTKMKDLSAQGMAQPIKNELKLPYIQVNKQQIKEHIIEVSVGGEKKMLIVNGNPRAAQAMNGLTNADQQSSIAKRLKKVSQFLAANFTTRNPTFIASNLMRDVGFAENSIAVKENGKYLLKFQKNLALSSANLFSPKNSLFWKYKHGYLDMKQETDRLFDEFLKNGGETGFVQLRSVEQFEKDIKHMLHDAQGGVVRTTAKKALLYIPDIVQDYNRRAEGVSRFTTYMTSRQLGRSIQRSISDAKEVTVNFNRKGAGLATGGFIGGFAEFFRTNYLFFNAGMQSLQTQIDLAKNHPIKYASMILGTNFAIGLMIPLLNQFLISQLGPGKNNSNNPYADLPEYMRRNNICIYAGNGNFITIPLAIELRAIYGLGEMVAGHTYAKDSESIKPAAEDIISQLSQILPIDFMANRNDANGHWYNFLVPDYAKPIVQNIQNTDWTGIPIQKETPYNKDYPEYTKAYKGTAEVFIATSKWLNDHSPANTPSGHGDAVVPGYINLSPGKFENFVTGYLGSMGQTAIDAGKTLSMIWSDEYRNVRNVPIAKALFKHSDERTQFMGTNEKYYNYLDEYKETERRISGYKTLVKEGNHPEYSGWELKLENEPYYERYVIFKGNQKTIQADDKNIKEFPDGSPEQKMWQTQLNLDKQTLVEQLNQVKDKK